MIGAMVKDDELTYDLTPKVRMTCMCLHVQRAARAVARRYDEALKPAGLTNGQYSLMMVLNAADAPTMQIISSVLDMDRTTVTANLKPLERRGLIKVTVDAADRRSRRATLTPAGRKVLAKAVPLWRRCQAGIERLVPDAERIRGELRALS
jgi:DNA-binding MarR family transcriptional regulator